MVDETGHSTGPHLHFEQNDLNISELDLNTPEEYGSTGVEENEQTVLEAILVTNMRIYDVLMAVYNKLDNPRATQLMKLHRQGHLLNEEDYSFE